MTKAYDRLLNLNWSHLEVSRDVDGNIVVSYPDCCTKNGDFLEYNPGRGATFEAACEDYLSKISGKTLVLHPAGPKFRKEITVL